VIRHTDWVNTSEITSPRVDDTEHESWAVGWLTVGLLFGPVAAFIGTYLVLRSSRWSARWKVAALALPVAVVAAARIAPKDGPASMFAWGFWIVTLVVAVGSAYVLAGAASRGSGQRRASRLSTLVIAAVLVGIASVPLSRLHSIGSYDYRDNVLDAARDADAAGERYGVVTESFFDSGDEHTMATVERLAGRGNARFEAIFDKLETQEGEFETSKLSPEELGTCYVFPIVTSRREGMESVTGLGRQCTGPSEAGSTVRLSDR
jgi:hypothetical protein